jgi:hypothetical protein
MTTMTEVAQRVLSELEEFPYDNVFALINTVFKPTGSRSEVTEFLNGVGELVDGGLVNLAMDRDPKGDLRLIQPRQTTSVFKHVEEFIEFDAQRGYWTDPRRTGPPYPEMFPAVVVSEEGLRLAREILRTRGYQWWRPRRRG